MPEPSVPYQLFTSSDSPPIEIEYAWGRPASVRAKYLLGWADADQFARDVMGLSDRASNTVSGITTVTPWVCPIPGLPLWAMECKIQPITLSGTPTPGPNRGLVYGEYFDKCIASVVWSQPEAGQDGIETELEPQFHFDPDEPVTMCSCNVKMGAEYVPVEKGCYYWYPEGGGPVTPADELQMRIHKRYLVADLKLKFPHVKFLPWKTLREFIGSVNSTTVFTCPPGTLLFEGPDTESTRDSYGRTTRGVELLFKYREVPWTHAFKRSGVAERIATEANEPLYPSKDHRLIFR